MTGVDVSLLIGLIIAVLFSWRNPRGLVWLGAGTASYVISTIAWRMDVPGAEVITAFGDAAICLGIYFFGRFRWEMWIWRLYQISVGISMLYLAGNIFTHEFVLGGVRVFTDIPHDIYSIMLEVINWLVLLSIGGSAALQGIRALHGGVAGSPWGRIRALGHSLWSKRTQSSFHKTAG